MTYSSIVISSGHSTKCQGANGILNEVKEATRVVDRVYDNLKKAGIKVEKFHDTVSTSQNENLNRIVDYHNAHKRDLDISVHFNAFEQTDKAMGTEVLYVTQNALAKEVSAAIASIGFIDRGPKKRTDLFFLNNTAMPAILIEVCFVDSSTDAGIYNRTFDEICNKIAGVIGGAEIIPPIKGDFETTGKCSYFGGPDDTGVAADEGLALCASVDDAPQLFLPYQPEGTSGLARRLNPYIHYVACRWDYDKTSKSALLEDVALVRSTKTGLALTAFPADWGPNQNTGRVADLSPGLLADLGLTTDDEVEVVFPYRE